MQSRRKFLKRLDFVMLVLALLLGLLSFLPELDGMIFFIYHVDAIDLYCLSVWLLFSHAFGYFAKAPRINISCFHDVGNLAQARYCNHVLNKLVRLIHWRY